MCPQENSRTGRNEAEIVDVGKVIDWRYNNSGHRISV